MGLLRASIVGAFLRRAAPTFLLLALAAGCAASPGDDPAGGGPIGGGGPGGGSGGRVGGPGGGGSAEWQDPAEFDDRLEDASAARVVVDPASGDAVAVWLQSDGSREVLWASRLQRSAGDWSAPEAIDDEGVGNSGAPQLAADGQGSAFAVWQQDIGGGVRRIRSSRLATTESDWSTDEPVKDDNAPAEDATAPGVAVDAGGDAVAVWLEDAGGIVSVWGNVRE